MTSKIYQKVINCRQHRSNVQKNGAPMKKSNLSCGPGRCHTCTCKALAIPSVTAYFTHSLGLRWLMFESCDLHVIILLFGGKVMRAITKEKTRSIMWSFSSKFNLCATSPFLFLFLVSTDVSLVSALWIIRHLSIIYLLMSLKYQFLNR